MSLGFGGKSTQLASYFQEVADHFATLEDDEEKALLAANAVEEVTGQEVDAACSPATAFTLEKLLTAADLGTALAFLRAVLETQDAFGSLATNKTGSHILEKVLQKLGDEAPGSDAATQAAAEQVLGRFCAAVVDNLVDCVTDRCGSHVARRLLAVAAGRDVSPAQQARKPKTSELFDEEDVPAQPPQVSGDRKQGGGLAARLAGRLAAGPQPATAPYPGVVANLTAVVLQPELAAQIPDLAYHTHASPWLQALLAANAGDGDALEPLVAVVFGAEDVDSVRPQAAHDMMEDRTGSHVLEAVLAAAPDQLFGRLWRDFFVGSLAALTSSPIANFVVQAALASARTGDQVKAALGELGDSFGELLSRRRTGVVAALLAAAGRLSAGQSEACRALSRGLTGLPAANVEKRGLAVALMTLDGAGQLGAEGHAEAVPAKHRPRLSPPGCAMLALLLRFPQDASQKFAKAIACLLRADAAAVGLDPGGTRVLEAFIQGPASAKQKRSLIRALAGSWPALACGFGSSHLVEKCFDAAGAADREAMVQELAAARRALYAAPRCAAVLGRTGADVYARSPAEWQRRCAAAAAVRSDFAAMLGDDGAPGPPHKGGGGGGKAPGGDAAAGAEQQEPQAAGKKAARKRAAAAAEAEAAGAVAAALDTAQRPKKKKRKPAAATEDLLPDANAALADVEAEQQAQPKKKWKQAKAAAGVHGGVASDGDRVKQRKKVKKGTKPKDSVTSLGGQQTTDIMQLLVGGS